MGGSSESIVELQTTSVKIPSELRRKVRFVSKTVPLRYVLAVCVAFILVALRLPLAFGHDTVLEAVPAMDGTVSEFPRDIQLTFSGEPKPDFNTLAISNSDTGEVVFRTTPEVSGRIISVHLPDSVNPGAGNYKIGYQITSSDGHATRGFTRFRVAGAGVEDVSEQAPTRQSASQEETSPQDNTAGESHENTAGVAKPLPWILLLVGLVVLAIGAVVVSKRKPSSNKKGNT